MKYKRRLFRRVISVLTALFIFALPLFCFSPTASAAGTAVSYTEYSKITVDGYANNVTMTLPTEWTRIDFYSTVNGQSTLVHSHTGSFFSFEAESVDPSYPYIDMFVFPFGTPVMAEGGAHQYNGRYLDLSNIPADASFQIDFQYQFDDEVHDINTNAFAFYSYAYNGGIASTSAHYFALPEQISPATYRFNTSLFNFPDNAEGWLCRFGVHSSNVFSNNVMWFSIQSITVSFSISSLYQLEQETGKTNAILAEVEKQLEANGQKLDDVISQQQQTNDKMDELISGGEAGDQLIQGGDKLQQSGAGMQENLDQIQEFEDQYFGDLENNLDDIVSSADITWLFPSLDFIQRYLNKIVAGVPSKYLVVFTLPMLLGIVMYILGHPVRAPRPDTSGDEVTRETFSTTTVLEGRNAGLSTTTRTVTTSQEIGRVHRE